MPRSVIAGSYSTSISNFLRKLHTVSHSDHTNLQLHQQCTGVLFSPHLHQHLLYLAFLLLALLIGVVIFHCSLICTSPIISDIEHLFMCLLAIYISSLEKCLLRSSGPFFKFNCFLGVELYEFFVFWILTPTGYTTCKYILPFCRLPLHFVDGFLHCAKAFSLI